MSERRSGYEARAVLDAACSEAQLYEAVSTFAGMEGWVVWHDQDSRRNTAGFPDLLLLRERTVWIELKRQDGRVSPYQQAFHDALRRAGQEVHVFRPSDWSSGAIERVLQRAPVVAATSAAGGAPRGGM
ncbi:MAG: VRR-NUC domain-containing protein [Dehalococcoidia bacterium]